MIDLGTREIALETAIAQLNHAEEIHEPNEAFQQGKLKGSPDLALEILKTIDGAIVFVGDVTPVGNGAPIRRMNG